MQETSFDINCPYLSFKDEKSNLPFEKKLHRKLQDNPNSEFYKWISNFADKLSCTHLGSIQEAGITLLNSMLDFPENSPMSMALKEYLLELMESKKFLDHCIQIDECAVNQAEKQLIKIQKAVEIIVYPSKLIEPKELPENLVVNPNFISDPRVDLFNIFAKSGNAKLDVMDDTIEMELALILAELREHFFQLTIPQDEKHRSDVELFKKNELQNKLSLIQIGEQKNPAAEKVHQVYKRAKPPIYMGYILNGNLDDKFPYINSQDKQTLYLVPIKKKQGYANPEVIIDHVHKALNNRDKEVFKLSLLKERVQQQFGDNAEIILNEYLDGDLISRQGVKALLFCTGYLQKSSK